MRLCVLSLMIVNDWNDLGQHCNSVPLHVSLPLIPAFSLLSMLEHIEAVLDLQFSTMFFYGEKSFSETVFGDKPRFIKIAISSTLLNSTDKMKLD